MPPMPSNTRAGADSRSDIPVFQTLHHVAPFTLGRVPAQAFGLFMSVNSVLAAAVGWIGLGQNLGLWSRHPHASVSCRPTQRVGDGQGAGDESRETHGGESTRGT